MVSMLRAPQNRGLKYNNLAKEVGKDCYYCLLLRNKATLTQSKNESEGETEAQIHCMCVYLQWTQTQVSTKNTTQQRSPRNSWTRSLIYYFFKRQNTTLMYTAYFWHLHDLPQQLSIISVCSVSCLRAVTTDFTFPVPHWLHATVQPHKRKRNLLCARSCTNLN